MNSLYRVHDHIERLRSDEWRGTHAYLPYQLIRLWVIAEDFPSIVIRELEEERE